MKAIIEARACFPKGEGDDEHEVQVEVLGAPAEDMEPGQILIVHPKVSIEINRRELLAALRMFEEP